MIGSNFSIQSRDKNQTRANFGCKRIRPNLQSLPTLKIKNVHVTKTWILCRVYSHPLDWSPRRDTRTLLWLIIKEWEVVGHWTPLFKEQNKSSPLTSRSLYTHCVIQNHTQQSHTHTHLGGVCMILCCQIYPGMGFKLSVSWQDQLSHGHLCDIVCVLSWYSRNRSWVWRRPKGLSRSCVLQGF